MSFKRHPVLILKLNVTENPLNVFSTASPLLIIISDKKKKIGLCLLGKCLTSLPATLAFVVTLCTRKRRVIRKGFIYEQHMNVSLASSLINCMKRGCSVPHFKAFFIILSPVLFKPLPHFRFSMSGCKNYVHYSRSVTRHSYTTSLNLGYTSSRCICPRLK